MQTTIYRSSTRKKATFWENFEPIWGRGGRPHRPPPLESATGLRKQTICIVQAKIRLIRFWGWWEGHFAKTCDRAAFQPVCSFAHSSTWKKWRRVHAARAPPPLSQMAGHRGRCELKNSQQETDQTVQTIAKALTKTTNCTFRAMEGHDQKNFRRFVPDRCPHFRVSWCPHFQIRSGATIWEKRKYIFV